jgi:hypothetical protein
LLLLLFVCLFSFVIASAAAHVGSADPLDISHSQPVPQRASRHRPAQSWPLRGGVRSAGPAYACINRRSGPGAWPARPARPTRPARVPTHDTLRREGADVGRSHATSRKRQEETKNNDHPAECRDCLLWGRTESVTGSGENLALVCHWSATGLSLVYR